MTVYKGKIITVNKNNDVCRYLVENNGKIVYVGNELPERFVSAPVIDLGEGALMPTFADTHGHFASYAMLAASVKLDKCKSNTEIIATLKAANESLPKNKAMLCFGASPKVEEGVLITKSQIDSVVPRRNVVIICGDGHTAVMNTAADAKMPAAVKNEEGYDGEHGWFKNKSFYKAVDNMLKVVSAADAAQAFQDAMDVYIKSGFGLICCESGTGFPLDLDVSLLQWLYRGQDNGVQVRIFVQDTDPAKAKKFGVSRLGGCFKCALDGSITSADAAFSEPYEGTDDHGVMYYTDEELYEAVKRVHLAGLAYQMHAIGDKAVMQAARTYKRVLDEYPRENHRHGIIHATLVPDEAMDIIEKYNIQIIGQPAFIELSEQNYEFMHGMLGERVWICEPHNEFIKRGINFSASSDCPVTFPNGVSWIHWMVNNPNTAHRVDLTNAIRVCTVNGYYNTFDEDQRGTLEVGKIADMIVLDKSPYDVPETDIININVLDTILGGVKYTGDRKNVFAVLLKGMVSGKDKKM